MLGGFIFFEIKLFTSCTHIMFLLRLSVAVRVKKIPEVEPRVKRLFLLVFLVFISITHLFWIMADAASIVTIVNIDYYHFYAFYKLLLHTSAGASEAPSKRFTYRRSRILGAFT